MDFAAVIPPSNGRDFCCFIIAPCSAKKHGCAAGKKTFAHPAFGFLPFACLLLFRGLGLKLQKIRLLPCHPSSAKGYVRAACSLASAHGAPAGYQLFVIVSKASVIKIAKTYFCPANKLCSESFI